MVLGATNAGREGDVRCIERGIGVSWSSETGELSVVEVGGLASDFLGRSIAMGDRVFRLKAARMDSTLERIEVGHDVPEGKFLLLRFLCNSIDFFEGRDAANNLRHSVGVKC